MKRSSRFKKLKMFVYAPYVPVYYTQFIEAKRDETRIIQRNRKR